MIFRTADVLLIVVQSHIMAHAVQSHLTNKHSKTETDSMCTAAL